MSARLSVTPAVAQLAEGETSGVGLRSPGSTSEALFGADPAVDALFRPQASEKLLEDLLRRFGTADPLPWRHGGLNE
jgi:hypothetical protein